MDASVLISGGGPAGLSLAIELGRRGIKTILFNEGKTTTTFPQATVTQARTMEHYRRLGFSEKVRASGFPSDYPQDISYYTRMTKHEIARFRMPSSGDAPKVARKLSGSWSTPEFPHRCSQAYFEKVLKQEADQLATVDLKFGWQVKAIFDEGDHAAVEAVEVATGRTQRFRGSFLVGCDGPRSVTRKTLGIGLRGESDVVRDFIGGPMLGVYFKSPDLYKLMPFEPGWLYYNLHPEQRGNFLALDGRSEFKFNIQLKPGEETRDLSNAEIKSVFERIFGAPCPMEIIEARRWTAGLALVAERYRVGRVFIAGDAAHLFTPTSGLGYCTAIEDTANLGWKIAAVLRGWGGPNLFESYQIECKPIAEKNTYFSARIADSIVGFKIPKEIEDETEEGRIARAAATHYYQKHLTREFDIPGINFGIRYSGSPIIVSDEKPTPADDPNYYIPTANPGGRAPHAWLEDGSSLFDKFNFEFTLLCLGPSEFDTQGFKQTAAKRGFPVEILDLRNANLRGLYEANYALVRPDQIIAWRGDRLPSDLDGLLAKVSGW